ncbi:MAG: zinc dependent phospholipase C family protein [Chloroflexota bacterium]
MPTPFSHLQITQRLLDDEAVPQSIRAFARDYRPDFLLGGIIADQRPEGGKRADTHFYEYTKPMPDNPWREMFRQHPSLKTPKSDAHKAFLMGYVAHLAADEYWSRYMLKPHFAESDWGEDIRHRFYLLHLLLITMDERDEKLLPAGIGAVMQACEPHSWLPFMSDSKIQDWRDFLAHQIDDHDSRTLEIFGGRIKTPAQKVRALLDDDEYMQRELWDNVSRDTLAELEVALYAFSREQLLVYLDEFFS